MPEDLQQQIRQALERLETPAQSHILPTSAQAWSRLQFRLAYRARGADSGSHTGALLAALYVLAFLIWTTGSEWLSASLLAVLASAAVAVVFLFVHIGRRFRN